MRSWKFQQKVCAMMILLLLAGCSTATATLTQPSSPEVAVTTPQPTLTAEPSATPTPIPPTPTPLTPRPTATTTPNATASPAPTHTAIPTPTTAKSTGPGPAAANPPFVAYTQITETGPEICAVNTADDPPSVFALTETPGLAIRPHWSPNVRFLAYLYQEPAAEAFDIWLIDNTGSVPDRSITNGSFDGLEDYAWSADSRFIVFHSTGAEGVERDVFRVDVESGKTVNLTADSPVWDSDPACSPNGKWIAFVSDRAEGGKGMDNIWIMAPDGSDLRQLTDTVWENVTPAWSPDSTEIAFYRWGLMESAEEGPPGLWVMNADGSGARLVIELSILSPGLDAPVWSPDGKWIAYQSGLLGESDIYVIPAEGGEPVRISDLPGHEYSVSWSPNSSSLIFTHETEDELRLYIAAPDGTDTRPLLDEGGNGLGDWQPAFMVDG